MKEKFYVKELDVLFLEHVKNLWFLSTSKTFGFLSPKNESLIVFCIEMLKKQNAKGVK